MRDFYIIIINIIEIKLEKSKKILVQMKSKRVFFNLYKSFKFMGLIKQNHLACFLLLS